MPPPNYFFLSLMPGRVRESGRAQHKEEEAEACTRFTRRRRNGRCTAGDVVVVRQRRITAEQGNTKCVWRMVTAAQVGNERVSATLLVHGQVVECHLVQGNAREDRGSTG